MTLNDLLEMKPHEVKVIDANACEIEDVLRVPGGWLYRTYDNDSLRFTTSTFVQEVKKNGTDFQKHKPWD